MTSSPTEGWYPDPGGVHQFRYHDGRDWTDHVADDGIMTRAPQAATQPRNTETPPNADQPDDTAEAWHAQLAREYARNCVAVLNNAQAALDIANHASGAWQMAQKRPQHEISIQTFTNLANQKEAEFAPLYQAFQHSVAEAREAGNRLSAQFQNSIDAEICLLASIEMEAYSQVGAAIEFLRVNFPSTARGFQAMIPQVNEAIQGTPGFGEPGFTGLIYSDTETGETNQLNR